MFDRSFLLRLLIVLCCWVSLSANGLWAQESEHKALLEGTEAYKDGNYRTAIDWFGKAIEDNTQSHKGHFNLGNALYKAKRYQEAASQFEQAQGYAATPEAKGAAYYNLGNSRLALAQAQQKNAQQQTPSGDHLKGAIDAYKQALRHNPKDYEAKNNLATAYKLLRQQQPPPPQKDQQNDQNKDDNQDEQDQKDKNQQQQQQDQQDQGQDEQDQQNDQQQPQSPPEEQQPIDNTNEPTPTEPREMTDIEAKRLLEMVEQEDKRVQRQHLERRRAKPRTIEKKW